MRLGKYYLFGDASCGAEIVLWNLPVHISAGTRRPALDQYNAAVVIAAE